MALTREVPIEVQKFIDVYTDPDKPNKSNTKYATDFKTTRKIIADWLEEYKPEIDIKYKRNQDMAYNRIQKSAIKAIENIEKIANSGSGKDHVKLKANEIFLSRVYANRTATDITSEGKAIVNIGFTGKESEAGNS